MQLFSETKLAPVPFRTILQVLQGRTPEQVMHFLTTDAEGEPTEPEKAIASLNPENAAAYLLEDACVKLRALEP